MTYRQLSILSSTIVQLLLGSESYPNRPGDESAEVNYRHRSPKGNRQKRRILNQSANAAVKAEGTIFEMVYRRTVPRPGHKQTIGAVAHQQDGYARRCRQNTDLRKRNWAEPLQCWLVMQASSIYQEQSWVKIVLFRLQPMPGREASSSSAGSVVSRSGLM
jgi:hypothetical protein